MRWIVTSNARERAEVRGGRDELGRTSARAGRARRDERMMDEW